MKITKVVIGGHPAPLRRPIPDSIAYRKTVTLNVLGQMNIFQDRNPDAIQWIEEILPSLMIGRPEDILHRFWSMDSHSWWCFDYGTKTLSLCSLEK